jgi:glycosyltransferase involved in cell wall biosynthesis
MLRSVYTSSARIPPVVIDNNEWIHPLFNVDSMRLPSLARANNADRAWDESCVQWIRKHKIRRVVFNGFPPRARALASMLRRSRVQLYAIYHGPQLPSSISVRNSGELADIVTSVKHGIISKIGVIVNEDAYQLMRKLKLPAERLSYHVVAPSALRGIKFSLLDNNFHIGMFGANQWTAADDRVALDSLLAAACRLVLTRPIVLHVWKWSTLALQDCPLEVMQHEYGTRLHVKRLIAQMDVTLDVPGNYLIALTALATGVPCVVVGQDPTIYDSALREIRDLLVCPGDSNLQKCLAPILDRIKNGQIGKQVEKFANQMNIVAKEQIESFLGLKKRAISDEITSNTNVVIHRPAPVISPPAGKTVVFITNELAYVTPGGAGTVVHAVASALAYAGVNVIILADMDASRLQKYNGVIEDTAIATGRLQAMQLSGYAQEGNHPNVFIRKSIQWADGIEVLLQSVPHVDVVEFVEYTGPAAVLLARRLNGQTRLPRATKIIVRVHGSYEFIDVAERVGYVAEREPMYLMERLAMNTADAVLVPSPRLGQLYIDGAHIAPPRVIVAAPPVQESLKQLRVQPGFCGSARRRQSTILPDTQGRQFRFLVLGKIQKIKGQILVIHAAMHLIQSLPPADAHRIRFSIVGSSVASADHMADPARELQEAIPPALLDHFEFREAVARADIPTMACKYDAAIIASTFESFNMVAHELHYLGIPIVISDFAAFADFFDSHNAHVFRHGNASSLRLAMRQVMVDPVAWTPIQYHDPLAAYSAVLHDEFLPTHHALAVSKQFAHDALQSFNAQQV